jgi:hypothetical protein
MIFIRDSPRMAQLQLPLPVRTALEDQRLLRSRRAVTKVVRSPVRPATLWMRVVSMASARVMAGRMVVSRRASIDVPAPGGPMRRTLWAERLHHVQLHIGYKRARVSTVGALSKSEQRWRSRSGQHL